MKKFLLLFLVMFLSFSLYANDTYFSIVGGSLVPTDVEETDVQMKEELIHIALYDKYYEVTVDFQFYNHGEAVNLNVGFPFLCEGYSGEGKIYDFKCWTNGKETSYADKPIAREWQERTELQNAYVRTVQFKKKAITKTRVQYKSEYTIEGPSFFIASYLYGSGKPWKGAISKIILQIESKMSDYAVTEVYRNGKRIPNKRFKRVSETLFETVIQNVEPEELYESISVTTGSCIKDTGPRVFPGYFFYKDRLATEEDVFWLSKSQLRLVRNMIYALHGYEFKAKDLKEYVEEWGKYWNPPYKVNPDFSEDDFSEIEKANIQFLLEQEKKW